MKVKKILSILLLIIILMTNFVTSYAKVITENERINLVKDHTCVSLLKVKGTDMMKTVAYVCYRADGKSYPAFCVQPEKNGIGTGAGDAYDITASQIEDNTLWRMLYRGYMGSHYTDWGLECDDDLYYATKTAIHCLADGTTPTSKYEIATRVGKFDHNITLEEVQRRSAKVLDVAQRIYDFGFSSGENYIKPQVTISQGELEQNTIEGKEYILQNYSVTANKELGSYKVSITDFPNGTKILSNSNTETQYMSNSNFKIAIPIDEIGDNVLGGINITEAKVKTYPIFYADSNNSSTQNYVIYADPTEDGSAITTFELQNNKSNLKIEKKDNKGNGIEGVTFSIKYSNGSNIGSYTTNANGEITIDGLKIGNIVVKEVSAPDKYIIDETEYNVKLQYNKTNTLTVTNATKQGYINVVKKDSESGKIVKKAGAVFEIYNENDEKITSITTNSLGIASSGLIEYGTYYIKELHAPYKYTINLVDNENVDIIENEQTYEVEFKNVRTKGSVTISKEDTITKKTPQGEATLQGATYGVYARSNILDPADDSIVYRANEKVGELVTDKNSNATLGNMYLGQYYLKEIKASVGYNLDTNVYDFDLNYENQNVRVVTKSMTVKERVISQAFEMIKVSSDEAGEAELLEGVEFTIKAQKDIDAYGSWEKAPIAKNANAQETAILITDEKGYAKSERLPYGTYIVRETKTPENKHKIPDFKVVITEDSATPQTWRVFNDTSFKSVLAIIKQDEETGKTVQISGAKFKIKNIETNQYWGYWDWNPLPHYVSEWETDKTGTVMTNRELTVGKYQLEEIKSPKGYVLSNTPIKFEISTNVAYQTLPDGNTPVITVIKENTPVKGKINLSKVGEVLVGFKNGKFIYKKRELANAKYEILAKEDILDPSGDGTVLYKKGTVVDTIATNLDGKATSKPLYLGEYSVKEIQAPEGFVLNSKEQSIELKYKDQNTSIIYKDSKFINDRQKLKLDLKKNLEEQKIFKNEHAYKDVKFGFYTRENIYNYKGNLIVEKDKPIAVTGINKEGQLKDIPDLPIGKYYIKELETNSQYMIDEDNEYDFEFEYQGQDVAQYTIEIGTIENKLARGTIKIVKKDNFDESKKLKNVEFKIAIRKDMKDVITNVKTDEQGIATFDNLELGTYYIQEVGQIDGYVLNDCIYEVEVKEDGDVVVIDICNTPTTMEFSKVNETGVEELEGATIQIIDKQIGEIIEEWVSTKESHIIRYLSEGKEYIMKEIIAPNGYQIAEEISFVAGDGKKVVMQDMPILETPKTRRYKKYNFMWNIVCNI